MLGRRAESVPVAAAVANALRVIDGGATAALAIWVPGEAVPVPQGTPPLAAAPPEPPGGAADESRSGPPATFAASRLAVRLSARGLAATPRGRLAWLQLAPHPVAAALAVRRLAAAVEVPVVVALAGPRNPVLEGILREQDLVVIVTPDPGGALARLAVSTSEVPAVACAPLAGPARLLAGAGLAGAARLEPQLRAAVQRLAEPVPPALLPHRAVSRPACRRRGPKGRPAGRGARGQASVLLVGACSRCSSARSCSARSRGRSGARRRRSGPPTSPRSPARGRCTARTRACSSRPASAAARTRAPGARRRTWRSAAPRRSASARANGAPTPRRSRSPTATSFAPVRVRVTVRERSRSARRRAARVGVAGGAEAELAPPRR